MEDIENRRKQYIQIRVSEEEREIIKKLTAKAGEKSMSAYLRKIALKGIIVKYDNKGIDSIDKSLKSISNNINQITMRINSTDRIYDEDIQYIRKALDEVWDTQKSILSSIRLITQ